MAVCLTGLRPSQHILAIPVGGGEGEVGEGSSDIPQSELTLLLNVV